VPAVRVVPTLEKIEDCHLRLGLSVEAVPIQQLALERREEALAHGVVEAVTHRTHRGPHPRLGAALTKGDRGVLRPLVRVVNHVCGAAAVQRPFRAKPKAAVKRTSMVTGAALYNSGMGPDPVRELIFEVREAVEGGYVGRALGESIFVEADDWAGLEREVRDAVACHFEDGARPALVRLHFVRDEVLAV
jgi:hypothetical protein